MNTATHIKTNAAFGVQFDAAPTQFTADYHSLPASDAELQRLVARFRRDDSARYVDIDQLMAYCADVANATCEDELPDDCRSTQWSNLWAFTPIKLRPDRSINEPIDTKYSLVSTCCSRIVMEVAAECAAALWTACDQLDKCDHVLYEQLKHWVGKCEQPVIVNFEPDTHQSAHYFSNRILLSKGFCRAIAEYLSHGNKFIAFHESCEATEDDLRFWYFSDGAECVASSIVGTPTCASSPLRMIEKSLVSASPFELPNIAALRPLVA
jgi:hypothetical protein